MLGRTKLLALLLVCSKLCAQLQKDVVKTPVRIRFSANSKIPEIWYTVGLQKGKKYIPQCMYFFSFFQSHNASDLWYFAICDKPYEETRYNITSVLEAGWSLIDTYDLEQVDNAGVSVQAWAGMCWMEDNTPSVTQSPYKMTQTSCSYVWIPQVLIGSLPASLCMLCITEKIMNKCKHCKWLFTFLPFDEHC